jgi:hypothetical protein
LVIGDQKKKDKLSMKLQTTLCLLAMALPTVASAACNSDASFDLRNQLMMGAPGPIKQFHVTGKHQCQSRQNIGYWANVETRDATDCNSGHSRLQAPYAKPLRLLQRGEAGFWNEYWIYTRDV